MSDILVARVCLDFDARYLGSLNLLKFSEGFTNPFSFHPMLKGSKGDRVKFMTKKKNKAILIARQIQ